MTSLDHLNLIKPEEFKINEKTFILSRFPASKGRELMAKYVMSAVPKLGDYDANHKIMLEILSYVVAVTKKGEYYKLVNSTAIDKHVEDWQELMQLEIAVLEYNQNFFPRGQILNLLKTLKQAAEQLLAGISMESLPQLLQTAKQA